MRSYREPFSGRYFGIWNVEGEGDAPVAMFPSETDAAADLTRRQALDADHDDHLDSYHHVLPCDVVGAVWNSYEPDPRAKNPLTPEEIVRIHEEGAET